MPRSRAESTPLATTIDPLLIREVLEKNLQLAINFDADVVDHAQFQSFANWFTQKVLALDRNRFETTFGGIGFFIGAISTYFHYPLGADFGGICADKIDASAAVKKSFEIIFGIASFLPVSILIGLPSKKGLEKLADYLLKKPVLFTAADRNAMRNALKALAHFFAAWSGVPYYKLLQDTFPTTPGINILLPMAGMISSYFACLYVELDLIDNYFLSTRREISAIVDARDYLHNKIYNARFHLQNMSDLRILGLHEEIYRQTTEPSQIENTLFIFKKLLTHTDDDLSEARVPTEPAIPKKSCLHKFHDVLAALIGAVSTYVLFSQGQQAAEEFLDWVNISDSSAFLANLIALLGIIPNVFFGAIYAKNGSDKIYQALAERQFIPSLKALVAYSIAGFSATPTTYLAIVAAVDNSVEGLGILPTFLGGALANALAFEALLDNAGLFYTQYRNRSSTYLLRLNLLVMLDKMEQAACVMANEPLLIIEKNLKAQEPVELAEMKASSSTEVESGITHHTFFRPRSAANLLGTFTALSLPRNSIGIK